MKYYCMSNIMNHYCKWDMGISIWGKNLNFNNNLLDNKVSSFHSTDFLKNMIGNNFNWGNFYKERHIFRKIAIGYPHKNVDNSNKNST